MVAFAMSCGPLRGMQLSHQPDVFTRRRQFRRRRYRSLRCWARTRADPFCGVPSSARAPPPGRTGPRAAWPRPRTVITDAMPAGCWKYTARYPARRNAEDGLTADLVGPDRPGVRGGVRVALRWMPGGVDADHAVGDDVRGQIRVPEGDHVTWSQCGATRPVDHDVARPVGRSHRTGVHDVQPVPLQPQRRRARERQPSGVSRRPAASQRRRCGRAAHTCRAQSGGAACAAPPRRSRAGAGHCSVVVRVVRPDAVLGRDDLVVLDGARSPSWALFNSLVKPKERSA